MSASVGADIEALCSKCGDVWHVVVAKIGAEIAKVQCKECGGYHRYRGTTAAGGAAARKPRASATKRAAGTRSRPTPVAEQPFKPDLSAPIRPYKMSETFRSGERITHPRFGVGVVEQSNEPGKMAVLFADGRRILAQAKRESDIATASKLDTLTENRGEE